MPIQDTTHVSSDEVITSQEEVVIEEEEVEVEEEEEEESFDSEEVIPQRRYSINSIESSEDEYLASDEELNLALSHSYELYPNLNFTGSLSEHGKYFINSLNTALESVELDKSLAFQAQISGSLNNENQKLLEKKQRVAEKLSNLQLLYTKYFQGTSHDPSRIDQMKHDINHLQTRIHKLKHGTNTLFKHNSGIINKYPIEYNQAKDKVLERQIEEEDEIIF